MNKNAEMFQAIDVYQLICVAYPKLDSLKGTKKLKKHKKIHGPYTRNDGRKIVIVQYVDGTKRTISYPKHLCEQYLGVQLDENAHTIDHWDTNKDNNNLSNLKIYPRDEHSANDTRRVKLVKFKCAWCKNNFERSPRLVRDKAKKNKAGPFCSRSCAGKYSRRLQLKLIDKFDSQQAVDSVYYKRKYVKNASLLIDPEDLIDYLCEIWD